jgi:hypothetical protein
MTTYHKDFAAGAASALNRSITEIMEHLADDGSRPHGALRKLLDEKLADLCQRWYRKGFNRGHRESHRAFQRRKRVPCTLRFSATRNFAPRQRRQIILESTLARCSARCRSLAAIARHTRSKCMPRASRLRGRSCLVSGAPSVPGHSPRSSPVHSLEIVFANCRLR